MTPSHDHGWISNNRVVMGIIARDGNHSRLLEFCSPMEAFVAPMIAYRVLQGKGESMLSEYALRAIPDILPRRPHQKLAKLA